MILPCFLSLNHKLSSLAVQCYVLAEVATGRFGNSVWLRYANLHLAGGNIRSFTQPRAQSFKSDAALAFQFQFRLAKIMEWRLAVDAAAVDNSNDSGRNWKLSMLRGIALLPRALGAQGMRQMGNMGNNCIARREMRLSLLSISPEPFPSPPHPDDCTCMQNDSSTCWFAPGNTRGVFGLLKRNNNFLSIQIIRTLTHCCVSIFSQPSFPSTVWAFVKCRRILQTRQTVCLVNN